MASLFESTMNTRAILPDSFRFIRSDAPCRITPAEVQWLLDRDVRTVVDLRTEAEQAKKPCPLKENPAFTYHTLPVNGGGALPESRESLLATYAGMNDAQMDRIIDTLLRAESNAIYFCNAGKDRTGMVTARLLRQLGYGDDYIIADYLLTAQNLRPLFDAFGRENPDYDISLITPQREYVEHFLRLL